MRFLTYTVLAFALYLMASVIPDVATAQMTRVARLNTYEWGFAEHPESVSIDHDRAVVGTWDTGFVHVLERSPSGVWVKVAELTPGSGTGQIDIFGSSVCLHGDRLVVGSRGEADGRGAVYVYERDGTGMWTEVARLTASDGQVSDEFGGSVYISGDRVLVLAPGSGVPYVFERDDTGNWTEASRLPARELAAISDAGSRVSVSGEWAIVGDPSDWSSSPNGVAVVVKRNEAGLWSEEARLVPSDGTAGNWFGFSVAISGARAIVGVPGEDVTVTDDGAAYVFERDGTGTWTEVAKLVSGEPKLGGQFGFSVSISEDRALVGEPVVSGTAYVFVRDAAGTWTEAERLVPENMTYDSNFGYDVSLSGSRAIVVAPNEPTGVDAAGAAYIFEVTSVGVDPVDTPTEFALSQNYPNPFNPTTTISYTLPTRADVTLTVLDVMGKEIRQLVPGTQPAGTHEVSFDATGLSSGVYVYRIHAGAYVGTQRMVVVK